MRKAYRSAQSFRVDKSHAMPFQTPELLFTALCANNALRLQAKGRTA